MRLLNRKWWIARIFSRRPESVDTGRVHGKAASRSYRKRSLNFEQLESRDVPAIVDITVAPNGFNPIEGQVYNSTPSFQPIAIFTTDNFLGFDQSSQLSAIINWGDGQITGGLASPTISYLFNFGNLAFYEINASHTYRHATDPLAPLTLTVEIFDNTGPGMSQASSAQFVVVDQPLNATPVQPTVTATIGSPLTLVSVATFTDDNPLGQASDFTATVTWGNPTETVPGMVIRDTNGTFHVLASHTYDATAPALAAYTVTIVDVTSTLVINNTATVNQAAIVPVADPVTIMEGTSIPAGTPVGSFTDLSGGQAAANYTAVAMFPNATGPTGLTVTRNGSTNTYTLATTGVTNFLTPMTQGVLNYALQVTAISGPSAATTGSLIITNAPLTLISTTPPAPTAGQLLNNVSLMVFSDAFVAATPANYTATINWGDGSPATVGTIVALGGGQFEVRGSHTYLRATAPGVTYQVTIQVNDAGGGTVIGTTAPFTVADAPIVAFQAINNFGTQNQQLTNVTVGTFIDSSPFAVASDYVATIDWGDGTGAQPAFVRLVGGAPGGGSVFAVYGSHSYATSGNFNTTFSVVDQAGSPPIINAAGGVASITQGAIAVTVLPLDATIDTPTTPGIVATFLDLGGAGPIGSYTATIDWGDGTPTSAGTIMALGGNQFSVAAPPHTYTRTGLFVLRVTVTDIEPASGVGANLVTVANSTMATLAVAPILGVVEGAPVTATVAAFTDTNLTRPASSYVATIDWGDGSPMSLGTVTGAAGNFTVTGTHTYARYSAAPFTVRTVITDPANGRIVAVTSVNSVADAALTAGPGIAVFALQDQPLNNVPVGLFTDANPGATAADFSVMINWGDGSPATPGIVTLAGGTAGGTTFAVSGSHVYTTSVGSPFNITYTVVSTGGSTLINAAGGPATITQGAVVVTVLPLATTIGTATPAGVVATFLDLTGPGPLANYTATIDWGDGTPTSAGTINALGGNQFSVSGPAHNYAQPGTYVVRVTVVDSNPATGIGANLAIVSTATLTLTPGQGNGGGGPIAGVEGAALTNVVVASFTTGNPTAVIADFVATIDWGDGSPMSFGFITQPGGPGTPFVIAGNHTYTDERPSGYTITVVVTDNFGGRASLTTTANIADAPLAAGPGIPVFTTEHQPLNNIPIGTFTDANGFATPAEYTIFINWGDGSPATPGFATLVGGSPAGAVFMVSGSHVYNAAAGSPFAITYTVLDEGGSTLINAPGGPATISQGALSVTAVPISATVNAPTAAGTIVATFIDIAGADPIGSYSAIIDWGDGTPTSLGTIASLGGNQFSVAAPPHTYTRPGAYAIRVTVFDTDPSSGVGGSAAIVANSVMTVTPVAPIVGAVEGAAITATVAAFTDTDTTRTPSSYVATIDWGDGSPMSLGTITGGAGTFTVTGTHTYARFTALGYTVRTVITDAFGGRIVAVNTVTAVADAPLTAGPAIPVFAAEQQPLNNVPIGRFTDANPNASASDFSVLINWGDGSPATPGIVTLAGGSAGGTTFVVSGSHVYMNTLGSPYTITYTVTSVGGSTLANAPGGPATISQGAIVVTVLPKSTTIGNAIPAGVVATFLDITGPNPLPSYTATIDWGDGSPTSAGTIANIGGNQFTVTAPAHNYPAPGTYIITVTVVDNDPAIGIGANLAIVQTAVITVTPAAGGGVINAVEGTPLVNVPVASFTTGNPLAVASNFVATIDWGDGSPMSFGTVTQPGGPGTPFVITGNHTYTDERPTGGAYPVTVVVVDNYGSQGSLTTSAFVTGAALINPVGIPQFTTNGHPLVNAPLGTFVDLNPLGTATEFTATINWGDGSPPTLGFVHLVGGNTTQAIYSVSGSHLYPSAGTRTVIITVLDEGGQQVTITTTVTVSAAQLVLDAFPIVAVEGNPTPAGQLIGSFFDPAWAPGTTYQVTINWGDGTFSTNLTGVVVQPTAPGSNTFNILAPAKVYADEGPYTVTITVVGSNGSGPVSAVNLATVQDAPLTGINGGTINAVEGNPIGYQLIVSFTDANPLAPLSDHSAIINWGDGTTSVGTISQPGGPGTVFLVSGNHTYQSFGLYPILVTIQDEGGSSTTATAQANVAVAPITMNGSPIVIQGQQNIALVNIDVATFTTTNPLASVGLYGATINWGDGTSSAGTLVRDSFGVFHVQGTHTYSASGSYFPVVSVTRVGAPGLLGQVTANVTISATPLIVTASPINGVQGNALPNAQNAINGTIVATFVDVFGADPIAAYTATIDWGNGLTTPGTIVPGAGPNFVVIAPASPSIVYPNVGLYTVRVTVTNADPNSPGGFFQAFGISTATIVDAPLTAAPNQPVVNGFQQTPLIGVTVSRFFDGNPLGVVSDFTATIDWGDGTPQSIGQVFQPGGPGTQFIVTGNHTYAQPTTPPANPYVVTVVIQDRNGSRLTTTTTANITASTLISPTPVTINGVEGQPLVNTVAAYFTDTGIASPLSSYTATINWGTGLPGSTTFGQIVPLGGNNFQVLGSYTYPRHNIAPGLPYSVTVTITHNGLPALTVVSQANIIDAPISGVAIPIFPIEAVPFTGTMAVFSDANPGGVATDFTATINWGDGFTTAGTVVKNGSTFLVRGIDPISGLGHTYTSDGIYTFSVTVVGSGGAMFTAFETATVMDGALSVTGINSTIQEGPLAAVPGPGIVIPTFNVATFTDAGNTPGNVDPPSAYIATINWGDGVVTTGTIGNPTLIGSSVIYPVSGEHLYANNGVYSLTITVRTQGTSVATTTAIITVTEAPLTAGPSLTVNGVQGQSFTATVATFTDANLAGKASDFTATINWGDGTSSAGVIGQVSTPLGSPTQFTVTGTHTYTTVNTPGTTYPISVIIRDVDGPQITATATAAIGDAPLSSTGATIRGVEGNSTGLVLIGTFTDSNPFSTIADFTTGGGSVTINWGDGTPVATLPASAITSVGSPSGVTYQINAAHTYHNPGNYAITVVVNDRGGAATIIQSLAEISDAPLTALPGANQPVITLAEGSTYTGPVFRFTDGDPFSVPADFTATINWGDGLTDTGVITQPGGIGTAFVVSGSHRYLDNGNYTIGVTVSSNGAFVNYITTAVVTSVAPTAIMANNGPVNENSPVTVTLSDAQDPSPIDTAAGFRYSFATTAAGLATTYGTAQGSNSAQFTFPDGPSTHTIFGRIIDKDGVFTDYQTTVTVNNVAPTATFNVTGPFIVGKPLTVSFTNPFDPSPTDTVAGFTYSYDFGTGTFGTPTTAASVTFTPTHPGVYIIRGRIIDKDGGYTEYTFNPNGQPPFVVVPNRDVFAVGAAEGGGPMVRVYSPVDNSLVAAFPAYEPTFRGGVIVAVGDVTGDGIPDIITGTGNGGGPVVKVFDGATFFEIASFFAYEPTFRGGVYVAVADVDGDGRAEIITGTGVGGGPAVKIFNGQNYAQRFAFFAYEPQTRNGVIVAGADVNGDGAAEIITGVGAGGGPNVRVFNRTGNLLQSFFAYHPDFRGGVTVSGGDLFGTGRADIVVGAGPGGSGHVRVLDGQTNEVKRSFFAFGPEKITGGGLRNGVNVNATHVGGPNGTPILIVAAGPDFGPTIRIFDPITLDSLGEILPYENTYTGAAYVG